MQFEDIAAYIENHAADDQLSVGSVARAFHMTPNALGKWFKRKTGQNAVAYIRLVRMQEACRMLTEHKDIPISAIARQMGYVSIVTFNRSFKAVIGMTPSHYRSLNTPTSPE